MNEWEVKRKIKKKCKNQKQGENNKENLENTGKNVWFGFMAYQPLLVI